MAAIKTMNGEQLLVKIGNGAAPEVFTHDCLINTERGIQFSSNVSDVIVPDCDSPTLPGWVERNKDGLSATVNGAGMVHTSSLSEWFAWFESDDPKNCRIAINVPAGSGGGHWAGAFLLTDFEVTGNRKEKATVSATLQSTGVVTWVNAV